MNEVANATSPAKPSALPESWVEKMFQRMEDRYGSLWSDRYGQFPRERVKNSWAEDLAGFTGDELKRGLDACKQSKFPPTLPEFSTLCRPPINPEVAFAEAVKQLRLRVDGKDTWSHPAIFWAAQSVGTFDVINLPWTSIRARWTKELNEFLEEAVLPEIPVFVPRLPAPGKTSVAPEEAKKRIEAAASGIKPKADHKSWARRILENPKAYPDVSVRFANEVLGAVA